MDQIQMEPELVTEEHLLGVLQDLMKREPLFHRRELVNSRDDFERETAEDFWETGASGRRYSREFVWATLKERYESSDKDEFEVELWETPGLLPEGDRTPDLLADLHVVGSGRPAHPAVDGVAGKR